MSSDSHTDEFTQLVSDTLQHLRFARELGIEHFGADNLAMSPEANAVEVMPSSRNPPRANPSSHALYRNAESHSASTATHRASPVPSHSSPPVAPLPDSPNIAAPPELFPQLSQTKTVMPKKNLPGPDVSELPAPQETLFGEITPADDESLPRRDETLEDIRRDIGECTRCPLYTGRTQVVHSDGNPKARLMFIGEAPGADEDASGKPFIGRAGQLLNKIVEAIGMKREDVFIGNVNRCRPPQNRTPTPAEAKTCKPFLLREIAIVQPQVLVVLGNTAMKNLLDTKEGITKLRGEFQDYRGIKVMPTFHPAYLLRDPSKKRETWDDMKKVREYLQKNPREAKQPEAAKQEEVGLPERD